ncbi:MAG: 1-deoxy-D-xylulose-5-phosphate reductoisomerase [Oscillospiraceae bacterium]|jgi:1-deoxy-D-xylulose-5-phosphate reductoisomerase|nr:1-deoxy-D-xylulose-5-phosphate reductoisomerase [Oscillospiraceae bacterium]
MVNSISLLGSTGSIGRQALEVAEHLGLRVLALSADRNICLLEEQVRRFKPAVAAVFDVSASRSFKESVRDLDVRVVSGADGLIEAACVSGADAVVVAVVGSAGLKPTLAAIDMGRRIALANKETLVCAGELVMKRARESGAQIIPVDSEHSAIFQCLASGTQESIKKIILTASGGPFRGMSREELEHATPAMALKHPNWSMGDKITIDSATLMNKGFEVIEAIRLFSVPLEKVSVVVHPESIVHSMVEFVDNSVMAQLAPPDMRLPIQYALTYPDRKPSPAYSLDITRMSGLTFEEPDTETFPCLSLALGAARACGTACAVLNGANEAAVDLFLRGRLGFHGIYESVAAALGSMENLTDPSLGEIVEAGEAAKRFTYERVKTCIL